MQNCSAECIWPSNHVYMRPFLNSSAKLSGALLRQLQLTMPLCQHYTQSAPSAIEATRLPGLRMEQAAVSAVLASAHAAASCTEATGQAKPS